MKTSMKIRTSNG